MCKLTVFTPDEVGFDCNLVASAVYKKLNQTDNLAVELNIVSPEEIKEINNSQRNINAVTDVLSFPSLDGVRYKTVKKQNFPLDIWVDGKSVFLGSIIICVERAKEQALEYGHSLERELSYLFCHGLLHLFGYDHITSEDDSEMRLLATEILKTLKIER